MRANRDGALRTAARGVVSGLCVDPIEKKPLYHFLPGTEVLSFGTLGCNLGCRFCQNWSLSRGRDLSLLQPATPEAIVRQALGAMCSGVAFTYNEPIISAEFCIDVAQACREAGLRTVAVTAGYIGGPAREAFFGAMDAANVDLKGFSEAFYRDCCGAELGPVLETLEYLAGSARTWLEVTTLLIPGANDAPGELAALAEWLAGHLGPEVPLHFTAFHPDYQMTDRPPTPLATLQRARETARAAGIRHVYLGNVRGADGGTTRCPGCGRPLIVRDGFRVVRMELAAGACPVCRHRLAGRFEA
jgi:pyruvate formate lyase activating enzyme